MKLIAAPGSAHPLGFELWLCGNGSGIKIIWLKSKITETVHSKAGGPNTVCMKRERECLAFLGAKKISLQLAKKKSRTDEQVAHHFVTRTLMLVCSKVRNAV